MNLKDRALAALDRAEQALLARQEEYQRQQYAVAVEVLTTTLTRLKLLPEGHGEPTAVASQYAGEVRIPRFVVEGVGFAYEPKNTRLEVWLPCPSCANGWLCAGVLDGYHHASPEEALVSLGNVLRRAEERKAVCPACHEVLLGDE